MDDQELKMTPEIAAAVQKISKIGMEMMAKQDLKTFSYLNEHALPGGVLFTGDSITYNFPVYEMIREKRVFNRGISGISAKFMKENIKSFFQGLHPDKTFLLIGINSLGQGESPAAAAADIRDIINWLKMETPESEIYLEAVYPINKSKPEYQRTVGIRTNEAIEELNHYLQTLEDVTWIDFTTVLKDEKKNLNALYTDDGMHPNVNGYEVILEQIKPYLIKERGE